ncbi:MAG TPA: hypothetical protein DEH09_13445 [Alcanivorax sp.]|nr:hypothetical protein [Alcanivorax sp.]
MAAAERPHRALGVGEQPGQGGFVRRVSQVARPRGLVAGPVLPAGALALCVAVGLPGAGQGRYGGGAGGRGQRFQEGAAGKSLQHDGGVLSAIVVLGTDLRRLIP